MDSHAQPHESAVRRYVAIARRRIAVLSACIILVPVVAVAYSLTKPKQYRAESTVLVSRQSLANQLSGAADVGLQQQSFQQVLTTQAQLSRTPTVLRATVAATPGLATRTTATDLEATSDVTADPTSDLLRFAVTRKNPNDAERLSLAYAKAYVAYRLSLDSLALKKALADLNTTIADARARGRDASTLVNRLSTSRQELETRLALQTANAQVVAAPDAAPRVEPRPLRSGLIGLALGLLLGALAVWLREALDTRVRTSAEAETELGAPVLARIRQPAEKDDPTRLAMLTAPGGVAAETFRILRTNLDFGIRSHEAKTVLLTSSTQGEGKSTTISNLAVAAALAGQKVALVDLDLRRPRLAQIFDAGRSPGLTGVALGNASLTEALVQVDLPISETGVTSRIGGELQVLPSGVVPPDPSEFVSTAAVSRLIDELRDSFDLVLIDAPPVLAVSDTIGLFRYADIAFLCVRLGVVRRPMLRALRSTVGRLGTPIAGIVITGASTADDSYGGYYGYSYGPQTSAS